MLTLIVVSLCAFCCVDVHSTNPDDGFLIGAFNVQTLGKSKIQDDEVVNILADVSIYTLHAI